MLPRKVDILLYPTSFEYSTLYYMISLTGINWISRREGGLKINSLLHRGRRIIVQWDTSFVQAKWVTNVGSIPVSLQWVTTLDVSKMFGRISGVSSLHISKQKFLTTTRPQFSRFCPTICRPPFLSVYLWGTLKSPRLFISNWKDADTSQKQFLCLSNY